MLGPQCLLDGEGTLIERLGLGILALVRVEEAQIMDTASYQGMTLSQCLFMDGEGALIERFGPGILAFVHLVTGQDIERLGNSHDSMLVPSYALKANQSLLQEGLDLL